MYIHKGNNSVKNRNLSEQVSKGVSKKIGNRCAYMSLKGDNSVKNRYVSEQETQEEYFNMVVMKKK